MTRATKYCPTCNEKRIYDDRWDAYFCPKCHQWLEPQCKCVPDPTKDFGGCPFKGWNRPEVHTNSYWCHCTDEWKEQPCTLCITKESDEKSS